MPSLMDILASATGTSGQGGSPAGADPESVLAKLTDYKPSQVELDPDAIANIVGFGGEGPYPPKRPPLTKREKIIDALNRFSNNFLGTNPSPQMELAQQKEQTDWQKSRAVAMTKWQQEQDRKREDAQKTEFLGKKMDEEGRRSDRAFNETVREHDLMEQARQATDKRDQQKESDINEFRRQELAGQAAGRANTARHERVMEGQGASRLDLERQRADKASGPTADEQRRSDLAQNMKEQTAVVRDILKRRPDLLGHGLNAFFTHARGAYGSSDPDVQALSGAMHRLGQVQMSSHGMRSAQGIEMAAKSIGGKFGTAAGAGLGRALDDADKSADTFIIGSPTYVGKGGQTPGVSTMSPGATQGKPQKTVKFSDLPQ